MKSDPSGGRRPPLILAALALLAGFVGLVLIDLRDDVLIGEDPDTGAGILGVVCVFAAVILLVTALLWNPVRRRRALLNREAELQRLYEDTRG